MTDRRSFVASPSIARVVDGENRPLWSVMIPTYHCAAYLRETLASVLRQDRGAEAMQIEVVDDCSSADDPQAVVWELAHGRAGFVRQAQRGGATNNFNTCIRRARGELVHILHGDDLVEPGFYQQMENLAEEHPLGALFASRVRMVDADGRETSSSERVAALERFGTNATSLYYSNPLRTPAVVVRRSFYEQQGGFYEHLVHVADWEMWSRAIALGGGMMVNKVLARYRDFSGNDTSRLRRTGEHLRECLRVGTMMASRHEDFDLNRFRLGIRLAAIDQIARFRARGDHQAAAANRSVLAELRDVRVPLAWRVKEWVASVPWAGQAAIRLRERIRARG
jgi:glycosyltransferase involved in cell wall biosynthesis